MPHAHWAGAVDCTGSSIKLTCIPTNPCNPTAGDASVWYLGGNGLYSHFDQVGPLRFSFYERSDHDQIHCIWCALSVDDGGDWRVISFPAEAMEDDPLGREKGEPLFPELWDAKKLAETKRVITSREGQYSWSALYQQTPIVLEGNMFPRDRVQIVQAGPVEGTRVRYWDRAGTEGGGDYTAGVLICKGRDGYFYVEDVKRKQLEARERDLLIRQTAEMDGKMVSIWGEQEPGSAGKDMAGGFVRQLAGYTVHTERVSGEKTVRAMPFAAQWQAGNVRLRKGRWNGYFLMELEQFPRGKHDDMVDAAGGAFNKISALPAIGAIATDGDALSRVSYWAGA